VVFDLKYAAQTGATNEIEYRSYWGYSGSDDESRKSAFLEDVRKKVPGFWPVYNPDLKGREWSALEYRGRLALAFYFDLDGDGKLGENEKILPTRRVYDSLEFITPDFVNTPQRGDRTFCRVLIQVSFEGGSSEPQCMWSPASALEGIANLGGETLRLILYSSNPGEAYDAFGSSQYSLGKPRQDAPQERLSSIVNHGDEFYRLTVEGRRSNGLPGRVLLRKDSSPTGNLTVKLTGSNTLQAKLTSLYLIGASGSNKVFFRISTEKHEIVLPSGVYDLNSGSLTYGGTDGNEWQVSFTKGPTTAIKPAERSEVVGGQPTLQVRAVEARNRYNRQAAGVTRIKAGTGVYLEPVIAGINQEVLSRFRQRGLGAREMADRPPKVTITGPGGKQVLSSIMEYG
jgi:hypothetical protein